MGGEGRREGGEGRREGRGGEEVSHLNGNHMTLSCMSDKMWSVFGMLVGGHSTCSVSMIRCVDCEGRGTCSISPLGVKWSGLS